MFAQLVMQGLARHAKRFRQAAQRAVRATQLGRDQRTFEGFDLLAEPTVDRRQVRRVAVQRQFQAQGETFGGVLQFAHVARPWMTQQQRTLPWLQFTWRQGVAGGGPFVAINAGALAESVVESELFGHEAGAFTGAQKRRIGKFEFANGGTLFLDEIESMSLDVQVKLLRLLQERVVERLGGNQLIPLDIRVIAATKEDLRQAADAGRFRADLYYRLNVAPLSIPPLRERGEDALLLFQHFAEGAAARHALAPRELQPGQRALLLRHPWPGNVRELQNAAERFALGLELALDSNAPSLPPVNGGLSEQVEAFERALIAAELSRPHGSLRSLAEALGVPRKTLHDKLRKHGLTFSGAGGSSPEDFD